MASFTDTGLDTSAEVLNDGEFGFVSEGAELVVDGADAVTGSGRNNLIVNGTLGVVTVINTTLNAYDFDGVDTDVLVGESGFVFSASGNALDLTASSIASVFNIGTIIGEFTAIQIQASDGNAAGLVTNDGSVSGSIGVIFGMGAGAAFLANTGVISSAGASVFSSGTGNVDIANSGSIISANGSAITLGNGNDVIVNSGSINGSVNMGNGDDLFDGRQGVQVAEGGVALGNGNDTFLGGLGDDRVFGGGDEDEILTRGGNDTIVGENDQSEDLFNGGSGVDLANYANVVAPLIVNLATGLVTGAFVGLDRLVSIENVTTSGGDDVVFGNEDDNLIRTLGGADWADGGDGKDRLRGGAGNDTLFGGQGNDRLFGEENEDRLFGDSGNDLIVGGLDRDLMAGGTGIDHFAFTNIADSGVTGGTRDRITDFQQGVDKIDVSGIDAQLLGVDDAFDFIGAAAFSSTAGELRFRQTASLTIVEMDQDGDGVADSSIRLDGIIALVQSDFIL